MAWSRYTNDSPSQATVKFILGSILLLSFVGLNTVSLSGGAVNTTRENSKLQSLIEWLNPAATLKTYQSAFSSQTLEGNNFQCPSDGTALIHGIKKFVTRHPTDAQAWLVYARAAICQDEKSEAIRALDHVETLMPSRSSFRREAGELWSLLGEKDLALRAFRASVTARPRDIELLRENVVKLATTAEVAATVLLPDPQPRSVNSNYLPESNMRYALETDNLKLADAVWDRSVQYTDTLSYWLNRYIRSVEESGELNRVHTVSEDLDFPRERIGTLQNGGFESQQQSRIFGWRALKSKSHSIQQVSEVNGKPRSAVRVSFQGISGASFNHLSQIVLLNETGQYELTGQWAGNLEGQAGGAFVDVKQLGAESRVEIAKRAGDWVWSDFSLTFDVEQVPERIAIRIRGSGTRNAGQALKGPVWFDNFKLAKLPDSE